MLFSDLLARFMPVAEISLANSLDCVTAISCVSM
jgi:hypothetical protein